jgi:hypothetical protein
MRHRQIAPKTDHDQKQIQMLIGDQHSDRLFDAFFNHMVQIKATYH